MTAPAPQKEKTAAVLFAGFMTLALGGAGLLVAALAVGAERMWNSGAQDRANSRDRRAGWLDNQRRWLGYDHAQRTRRAAEIRDWLDAGGDPATRPDTPPRWRRFRNGVRRAVARAAVRAADFAAGARDGWRAANEVRRSGGRFRDIATARPGPDGPPCAQCQRTGMPLDGGLCADCVAYFTPPPAPAVRAARVDPPPPVPDQAPPSAPVAEPLTVPDPISEQENPMPDTPNPTPPAQAAAAESNATVMRTKLLTTRGTLSRIADLTDQLARERSALDGQVCEADEFATATGQSAQVRQALDESRAVATAMGDRLGEFSQGAVSAEEQMLHASNGLRVAEEAEDALRSAGADGRAVAPAGANA